MSIFICVERFVDPDLGWNREWFRRLADEADGSPKQLSAVAVIPVVDGTRRIVACASE